LFGQSSLADGALEQLPLVTLYLSERCNSRCITCDYWRHGREDMTLERISRLLPSLAALGTRVVQLSGGEPLVNPAWREIAQLLRDRGLALWLLTSGLSLGKHARRAAQLFDRITVSLDGARRETYAAIRGVDALDHVVAGIRAAADAGAAVGVRATLQRSNLGELPALVELAHSACARQISFLAADVSNPHAFARRDSSRPDVAPRAEELPALEGSLRTLERAHAADFESGFIAESPRKLERILLYFRAVCGLGPYPPVRCNAPEFSAVIGVRGRAQPCFFIPGPAADEGADLLEQLNGAPMRALRADIRAARRAECSTCVCTMWRDPVALAESFG
jgi:Fe-coproporphyrin III synthase